MTALSDTRCYRCSGVLLFDRDVVDKSDTSLTGPTRMSTESLPSKALSMASGTVLSPVGDSEPLDRSISQPNIAGGLKLPAIVPPSPTVLASCSSTSSDLSRGGYVSADSLGSMSSKDDTLSAPFTSDETRSLTTERSTRSASPCHENVPSLSLTVEKESLGSSSLSVSLEPTPDLVLNLPTVAENTAVTAALSPTLTSAELFASAEHGTIKKGGTPVRLSVSGEDGTSTDDVFPHTPVEITEALESDSFNFDLLPSPPPALTDADDFDMKSTDEDFELPPPDLSVGCEPVSHETSSSVALSPCTDDLPGTSAAESCSSATEQAVCMSPLKSTSIANTVPAAEVSEVLSTGSLAAIQNDDGHELKSSSPFVGQLPEPSVSHVCSTEILDELAGSLDEVCAEGTDVPSSSAAELQPQSASVTTVEHSSSLLQSVSVAAELPEEVAALSEQSASTAPDVVQLPPVTLDDEQTDSSIQSTASVDLRTIPLASFRPVSSPPCTEQLTTVLPQSGVITSRHSAVGRRLSESAVVPPQSADTGLMKQATSVAFPSPLPHRPPPSLAAHSAALQLLSQRTEPTVGMATAAGVAMATAAGVAVEKHEVSAKLEISPSDRPKSKPPPVKKKPSGPLKEKFFSPAGDNH